MKHQVLAPLKVRANTLAQHEKSTLAQAYNKSKMEIEKSIKRKFILESFIWSKKRRIQGVKHKTYLQTYALNSR